MAASMSSREPLVNYCSLDPTEEAQAAYALGGITAALDIMEPHKVFYCPACLPHRGRQSDRCDVCFTGRYIRKWWPPMVVREGKAARPCAVVQPDGPYPSRWGWF